MQQELNFDRVTFSREVGERAKTQGMDAAARTRQNLLAEVRAHLRILARTRPVSADDAQEYLISQGLQPMGNAAGSLFSGHEWECVGRVKSKRVSRHANEIRLWRLK